MNNLLYSARMALRDIYEVNIFTKGNDRVYLSISHDLKWGTEDDAEAPDDNEQDPRRQTEQALAAAKKCLGEMDLMLVGGDAALTALMDAESVEIVRRLD